MALPYVGPAAAAGVTTTITFDAPGPVVATDGAVTIQFAPAIFSGGGPTWGSNKGATGPPTGGSGNFIANWNGGSLPLATTSFISFGSVVNVASFNVLHYDALTLTAVLAGSDVESFVLPGFGNDGAFHGFTGINFDILRFATAGGGGGDLSIDNLGFGAAVTPEINASCMASPLAWCLGMLLVLGGKRRRHTAMVP